MNREEMILSLEKNADFDIVVIGGGASGLGSALDAASRGYRTLLIEAEDFGKATSSRSTKLVHGGVRYLAQGNFKLVSIALKERGYLLKNAPALTRSLPFVIPTYSHISKWYYGIGLRLYDLMSGKLSIGSTKWLSKTETEKRLPGIKTKGLKGGILYYDGQFDDARLLIAMAKTAHEEGAMVLNYCRLTGFLKEENKISGITFEDVLSAKAYTVKTKAVINATGIFCEEVMRLDNEEQEPLLSCSQGVHLVFDKSILPAEAALMVPKTTDKRVLFAIPWHNKLLVGTTDTPVVGIAYEPVPLEEEVDFVLENLNRYLQQPVSKKDIKSKFAGLRPLIKKKGEKNTALLSRDHTIMVSNSRLVTLTGGKWTTYRRMAEEAVDNASFVSKLPKKKCITKDILLTGNPPPGEQDFLHQGFSLSKAVIKYFVDTEMARTVEDILARRTRILFLDAQQAREAAPHVADWMAEILDKSDLWKNDQIKAFEQLAAQYANDITELP